MDEQNRWIDIHFFKKHLPYWLVVSLIVLIVAGLAVSLYYREKNYIIYLGKQRADIRFAYGSMPQLQNPEFFEQVKSRFVNAKADFVEADLSAMILRVYENGEKNLEVKILSKGRKGSWWETPAGLYKIGVKEPLHYSSIGGVYMPWSMQFQGNFFIHGWPYYPDDTPVQKTYSGGCIRLSTGDSKEVYDLVKPGTPVLVYENEFSGDSFAYAPRVPHVSSGEYLAADLMNNYVFVEKNSDKQVPIASITKLMTALVATDFYNVENEITVKPEMLVYTSKPRLKSGRSYSVLDLLHLLLRESSNEAAKALADSYEGGESGFVAAMNEKAAAVGMDHTHFVDASGSDDGDISTAQDLFALSKYLYINRKFILSLSRGVSDNASYPDSSFTNLENFNVLADKPGFVGGKVGLTRAAGGTAVAILDTELNGATRPAFLVVLGSPDYTNDMNLFYNWLVSNY